MERLKSPINFLIGNASVDAEGNLRDFSFGPVVTEEVELRVAA